MESSIRLELNIMEKQRATREHRREMEPKTLFGQGANHLDTRGKNEEEEERHHRVHSVEKIRERGTGR